MDVNASMQDLVLGTEHALARSRGAGQVAGKRTLTEHRCPLPCPRMSAYARRNPSPAANEAHLCGSLVFVRVNWASQSSQRDMLDVILTRRPDYPLFELKAYMLRYIGLLKRPSCHGRSHMA